MRKFVFMVCLVLCASCASATFLQRSPFRALSDAELEQAILSSDSTPSTEERAWLLYERGSRLLESDNPSDQARGEELLRQAAELDYPREDFPLYRYNAATGGTVRRSNTTPEPGLPAAKVVLAEHLLEQGRDEQWACSALWSLVATQDPDGARAANFVLGRFEDECFDLIVN